MYEKRHYLPPPKGICLLSRWINIDDRPVTMPERVSDSSYFITDFLCVNKNVLGWEERQVNQNKRKYVMAVELTCLKMNLSYTVFENEQCVGYFFQGKNWSQTNYLYNELASLLEELLVFNCSLGLPPHKQRCEQYFLAEPAVLMLDCYPLDVYGNFLNTM